MNSQQPEHLKKWVDNEYSRADGDPWGLDWRPSQKYRYNLVLELINHHAPSHEFTVLDIGCATGHFSNQVYHSFNEKLKQVNAIDISEIAIERSKNNYPHINFMCMGIEQINTTYQNKQDIIICLETLYYLNEEERKQAVSDMIHILEPNGLLIISSLNSHGPYLLQDEITSLLGDQEILEVVYVCAKPFIFIERIVIKVQKLLEKLKLNTRLPSKLYRFLIRPGAVSTVSNFLCRTARSISLTHTIILAEKS